MPAPKKRKRKRRGRIKVSKKTVIRRKNEASNNDTLPQAPTIVPNNGVVFRVKIKRK